MKEEIVQMDESTQAVTGLGLMAVMQQAETLQAQGQLREAIDLYALWLKESKEPTRYVVYFNMASMLQSMGDMAGAEQAYQSAIDLNPSFGQAYINLGLLYERQGLKQKALLQWNSFASQRFLFATLEAELLCLADRLAFPVVDGIARMLVDEARKLDDAETNA